MDIKQAIAQAKTELGKSGHAINCGECEDFAMRVIDLMGGYSNELTDGAPDDMDCYLPGHYWIEYKGKYYDAECSSGASDWHKLPIFKRFYQGSKLGYVK